MKILALDTTTPSGSVALLEDGRLIAEAGADVPLSHSSALLSSVDYLLKRCGLTVEVMDGFAVAAGPGSFTGMRIGLSTVKAFSFASGKPVAAVSTLEALAWKLRAPQPRFVAPILDAKKGEIYAALFECSDQGLKEIVGQGAYPPDYFLSLLPRRIIHYIGNGLRVFKPGIGKRFKGRARICDRSPFIAVEVGLLGYEKLKTGGGVDFKKLEPIYFRKSQAEDKR